MNKIYKVVWSKVKHCYVVTSELAKRNTKGCGARSLRMAAVSVGVAAALIGGVGFGSPVAEAADPVISGSVTKGGTTKNFTQANFTYESGGTTYQNDYGYANTFFDGESATPPTEAKGYAVNITSAPNWRFFVGAGIPYGTISDNSVTVNGDSTNITQEVIGGYAYGEETGTKTSTVTKNSVTVNGGTLASVSGANMGGYWAAPGTASDNTVTINAGLIKGDIRGAFGYDKAEENKVYIKGGTVDFYNDSFSVTGGESGTGTASNNEVIISDGTAGNENGGGIRGGMSWRGQANENKVTISGGTVKGAVYGGMNSTLTGRTIYSGDTPEEHTPLTGTVSQNGVIISAGTVTGKIYGGLGAVSASGNTVTIKDNAKVEEGSAVYGGSAMAKYITYTFVYEPSFHIDETVDKVEYGTVTGNTINIEDSASVTGEVAGGYGAGGDNQENKVYVKGGTVTGSVYGARINSTESTAGNATANEVHISNGTITGNVFGGSVEGSVAGDVKGNKVEISGGTIQGVDATIYDSRVYGGYSEKGTAGGDAAADGNNVTVTGGTVYGEVWGGYAKEGNAKNNTATMSGGNVEGIVMGGWAYGDATDNTLTVTGGTLRLPAGGYSDHGNANNNTVNFGGTAVSSNYMYGGQTYVGSANDNTVNITGGTVKDNVSGGYADSAGIASGNTVNMSNGTVTGNVRGGQAYEGNADNNTVSVSGTATVGNGNYAYIYGGWTDEKAATGNTVTIGGGKVNGTKGAEIYGGYTNGNGATTNNTVNLTGSTTGLENAEVYGGNLSAYTGNELHVGGTKDGSVTGAWTGSSNNTVNKVSNFETIVYHSVKWSSSVAALEATTVENVGAIDINNLAFDSSSATGTMALLKSDSDLSGIKLNYSGGTGATITTEGVTFNGGSGGEQTETDGVNGVKLTALGGREKVWLATDSKAINYEKLLGNVTKISFGKMTWGTGRTADAGTSFAGVTDDTIDTTNLQFSNPEAASPNATMKLLSGAENLAAGTNRDHVQTFDYELDNTVSLNATLSGTVVRTTANEIGYQAVGTAVNSVDLAGWDGTAVDVSEATAGWTLGTGATITTGDLADAGLDTMNPGDVKTIVTAGNTVTFTNDMISGSKAWQDGGTIDDSADTSGVSVAGTTTGGGVKVDDTNAYHLVYQKDKKDVATITLGSVAYTKGETVRKFDSTYDLATATINAEAFSIANPTATMNAGDTMVIVDAADAIADSDGKTLKEFAAKTLTPADFSDAVSGTVLTFAGTHTDTLEQNSEQTQIVYKVGDKNVETVTFAGSVTWDDSKAYYTNDADRYKFAAANVDAADLIVTGTTTKALKKGDAMTLLSAENMTATIATDQSDTNKTASKITVNYSDTASGIAIGAEAAGQVKAATGAVNYEVTGVSLNNVDLANWNGTAADVSDATAGWTLSTGAEITTGDLANAGLSDMNPGDVKTILTAADTVTFTNDMISGNKAWQDGGEIDDSADNSGVKVTGVTTGGGVKVDESNTHQLVYQKDKKDVATITLGSVAYEKGGTARAFDSTYDLTAAAIDADGFSLSNGATATMNPGDTMVVVDATKAIKGTGTVTLQDFETKTMDPLDFSDSISQTVLTFAGKHTDTLEQNSAKTQIVYKVGDKNVETVTLNGSVTWNDSKAYYTNDANKYKFVAADIDASNLKVTGSTNKLLKADGSGSMTLLSAAGMSVNTFTDQSDANKAASKVTVNYKDGQGVAFAAEAKGAVTAEAGAVKYNINEVKLTNVDLSGWTGSESSVPGTWTADDGSVKVAAGSFAEPDVAIGSARTILTAGSAFFADDNISGANKYDEANGKAFSETQNNVTVSGTQAKGVAASEDSKSLVYKVDIKKADTVSFGATNWQKGATLFDGSSATEYDYANVTAVDTGKFDVTYASPEKVVAGESMTLLKANETLTAIINEEKAKAYRFSPVSGVTVDAAITGKLTNSNNNVVFTAAANQASKLTFGDVEWKDSDALMARPSNITFAGADVDTSKINFTNMIYLDADRQMTLVSDFGDKVGTITGSKYLVGTAFEGEGAASLSGSDLVFRTKTGAGVSEQTHKTVMATEVGVTMLTVGKDYIGKAMEGMGDLANVAPDGTTVGAAIGGGRNRYETGSHVNVNSWNAAVAVGAKRELKNGSLEYGVFGEYGKANFTLHSDAGKGDGDSHYAGGGLLAKWTNKHDVYTEASFRLGRLNESSNDIMRDGLGNKYGYDVHANYLGAHVGVGKIFRYKGGKSLDVYGKYFYTKRDGVEFDAVQHYKLDSVASSVLRIGARYGTTDKKWNWYGGLAYEYEFDGEAKGSVNGTEIRAASIKGSSVRGEIGMRMNATKTNPWQMDISIYGYGGKHRGFGGNVNVAYMF